MLKRITSIALLMFLCSFRAPSNGALVYGHLVSRSHKTNVSHVTVMIKQSGFFNYYAETDNKGNFELEFSTEFGKMKFYYIDTKDTVYITTVNHFSKKQTLDPYDKRNLADESFDVTFYIP